MCAYALGFLYLAGMKKTLGTRMTSRKSWEISTWSTIQRIRDIVIRTGVGLARTLGSSRDRRVLKSRPRWRSLWISSRSWPRSSRNLPWTRIPQIFTSFLSSRRAGIWNSSLGLRFPMGPTSRGRIPETLVGKQNLVSQWWVSVIRITTVTRVGGIRMTGQRQTSGAWATWLQ